MPSYLVILLVILLSISKVSIAINEAIHEFDNDNSSIPFLNQRTVKHINQTLPMYDINSLYVKQIISTFPPSWQHPVLIICIADEKYIGSFSLFVESLTLFGFDSREISVICVTKRCYQAMMHFNVTVINFHLMENNHRMRDQVSIGKAKFIRDALIEGYSVFYFDLDIYFRSCPLKGLSLRDDLDLYVQYNGGDLNYGMFIAKPTSDNVNLFQNCMDEYIRTRFFDQSLFNRYISLLKIKHQRLNTTEYYLHVVPVTQQVNPIRAVHMICVEGAELKLLLGRELYGPFHTPSHYRDLKLVTFEFKYDNTSKDDYQRLQTTVDAVVNISQATGRGIRVVGYDRFYKLAKSFLNVDYLMEHKDIRVVESRYWENRRQFEENRTPKVISYRIDHYGDISQMLQNQSLWANSDDVVLSFGEPYLNQHKIHNPNFPYICKFFNDTVRRCVKSCNAVHF